MEENDPRGIEGTDTDSVRDTARADLADAERGLQAAIIATQQQARSDLADAERSFDAGIDLLSGIARVAIGEIEKPVIKYVDKLKSKAALQLNDVYQSLIMAGGSPVIAAPDLIADMQRDDPYESAMEQLIMPIIGACEPPLVWSDISQSCTNPQAIPPAADLPPEVIPPPTVCATPPPTECFVRVPCATTPAPAPPSPPTAPPPPPDDDTVEIPAVPCQVWDSELGEYRDAEEGEECAADDEPAPPPAAPPAPRPFRPAPAVTVPAADLGAADWSSLSSCEARGRVPVVVADQVTEIVVEIFRERILKSREEDRKETAFLQAQLDAKGEGGTVAPVTIHYDALKPEMERMMRILAGHAPGLCVPDWTAVATLVAKTQLDAHLGGPWQYLTTGDMYSLKYSCPQFLPSQENCDNMYMTGVIDKDAWTCLTRANGNHVWARELVLRANRSQPLPSDLLKMMRMGLLTPEDFRARMHNVGITDKDEQEMYVKAQSFIPTYQDIVHMMVRDVEDEEAVRMGDLDAMFDVKYKGVLKEWAKVNNIDETVMRYIWRAHWRTPSYTQGVTMVHRLRKGRVDDKLVFNEESLSKMLAMDDMAPGYIQQMVAMSYNAITRTDIKQFLTNGAIDQHECIQSLMDTGYNERDAKRITEAWMYEVANTRQNRSRMWTRAAITKRYVAGEIDRETADKLLRRTIPDAVERTGILDDADLMRSVQSRAICIKGVKRRRITGELNEMDSRRELVNLGMDVTQAVTIAEGWTCHITSMQKEPTVKMLTEWFVAGIIDVSEFDRRLRNLRYTPQDANRIIDAAVLAEQERRAKLAVAQAEKQEAKAEKARKEAEKQAEKRKKEAEAAAKAGGQPR